MIMSKRLMNLILQYLVCLSSIILGVITDWSLCAKPNFFLDQKNEALALMVFRILNIVFGGNPLSSPTAHVRACAL